MTTDDLSREQYLPFDEQVDGEDNDCQVSFPPFSVIEELLRLI